MGHGRCGLIALVALLAGCGDSSGSAADAARADDGALCTPFADRVCESGNLVFADSCGNLGELSQECTPDEVCDAERDGCCRVPSETTAYAGAPNAAVVTLLHPARAQEMSWTVTVDALDYVEEARGQRLRWGGIIDGNEIFVDVNTHIVDSDPLGPGIAYLVGGTADPADVEASGTSFVKDAPAGGALFLRRAVALGPGSVLSFRLVRQEEDTGGDWFALFVQVDGGAEDLVGRGRFLRSGGQAADIDATTEVKMQITRSPLGDFTVPALPAVAFTAGLPTLGTGVPSGGTLRYPVIGPSDNPFTAINVAYDADNNRLSVAEGIGTHRCTGDGSLF